VIRAYCYSSGLIEFGARIPAGATVIARGPEKDLREFIATKARHGYLKSKFGGRRAGVSGGEHLLVPGIPEAENQAVALGALHAWAKWIAINAPRTIRVLPR